MTKIYQKSFPAGKNAGFTLIELLVVIFIVGLLAAVALPKYELAVLKSRFANARQVVAQYKAAEEAYYMANGLYTTDISNLDISFPNCNVVKDMLICDNYFQMDPLNGTGDSSNPSNARLQLLYCPPDAKSLSYEQCLTKAEFLYTVWLDQSSKPGITTCTGTTDLGKKFCKTVS